MQVKATPVYNGANVALLMLVLSIPHLLASSTAAAIKCHRSRNGASRPTLRRRSIFIAAENAKIHCYGQAVAQLTQVGPSSMG